MAAITYKTIINNAIKGYNDIQDKLSALGSSYTDSSGGVHSISSASTSSPLSVSNILLADAFNSASISAEKVSLTAPSVTISASAGTAKLSSTDTGYSITIGASSSAGSGSFRGKATSAGYIKNGSTSSAVSIGSIVPTISGNGTYYIQAGSRSVGGTVVGNPSASGTLSGTGTNIATTTAPTGTDGTNYWSFTPSVTTSNGSVKATATTTEGYVSAGSSNSSISVPVSGSNGSTYYISKLSGITFNASGDGSLSVGKLTDGYYPLTAPSLSVSGTTNSAGYINNGASFSGTLTNKVVGKILAGAYSASASNAVGGMKTSSTATSYYVTSTGTASINTAGYIPTGSSSGTATTYIQAGSYWHSNNTTSGIETSSTDTGYSVSNNSGTGEGYIGANNTTKTTYIKAGSVSVDGGTVTDSKPSISANSDKSEYYVTLSRSATASVSGGYIPTPSSKPSATVSTTATIPTQAKTASAAGTVTPDSGNLLRSVSVPAGSISTSGASVTVYPSVSISTDNTTSIAPTASTTDANKYEFNIAAASTSVSGSSNGSAKLETAGFIASLDKSIGFSATAAAASTQKTFYINKAKFSYNTDSTGATFIQCSESGYISAGSLSPSGSYDKVAYSTSYSPSLSGLTVKTSYSGDGALKLSPTVDSFNAGYLESSSDLNNPTLYLPKANLGVGGYCSANASVATTTSVTGMATSTSDTGYAVTISNSRTSGTYLAYGTSSLADSTNFSGSKYGVVSIGASGELYGNVGVSGTIDSASTDNKVIYIKAGSSTVSGSVALSSTTIGDETDGVYPITLTGTITPTVNEGYIKSGTAGTVSTTGSLPKMEITENTVETFAKNVKLVDTNQGYYIIAEGRLKLSTGYHINDDKYIYTPKNAEYFIQPGSYSASSTNTASSALKTTTTANDYYVQSVGKATVSEGYVGAGSADGAAVRTYIKLGAVSTPTGTAASTSTTVSSGTVSLSRSVSPTVTEGYVTGGTAGTVSITADIGESKTATSSGTVTPSANKLLASVSVPAASIALAGGSVQGQYVELLNFTTGTGGVPSLVSTKVLRAPIFANSEINGWVSATAGEQLLASSVEYPSFSATITGVSIPSGRTFNIASNAGTAKYETNWVMAKSGTSLTFTYSA